MSRTDSPAVPRWPISRAAVAMRYSRRSWPSPSRRTAGFLGDIALKRDDDSGGAERGGVPEQHEPAGPLLEQLRRRGHRGLVEGLAGVEGLPAREPRTQKLAGDAFNQGDPRERGRDSAREVADEGAEADAAGGESDVDAHAAAEGAPGVGGREMQSTALGRPPGRHGRESR